MQVCIDAAAAAVTWPWGVLLHLRVEDSDLPRPRPVGPFTLIVMERQGGFIAVTGLLSRLPRWLSDQESPAVLET